MNKDDSESRMDIRENLLISEFAGWLAAGWLASGLLVGHLLAASGWMLAADWLVAGWLAGCWLACWRIAKKNGPLSKN